MSAECEALRGIMGRAGNLVRRLKTDDVSEKSALDYVTNVDYRLDEFLTEELTALTPGTPVLSEERPFEPTGEDFWIIDPIDGTHNMMVGLPFFAVCAALFDGKVATLSAVLDVASDKLYLAERKRGATLDDVPLLLPEKPSTLIALSSGTLDALNGRPDIFALLRKMGKLRNLGSQALHLACVADGRLGLALSEEARFWDDAAARLIAEEAGARYRSFSATSDDDLLKLGLSKAPLRSLCSHPSMFDRAGSFLSQLWPEG